MRAGDLLAWQVQTALPAGYNVTYYLTGVVNGTPVRIVIPNQATDGSGNASFSIPSTTTAAWQPGRYNWVCFYFDPGNQRYQLAEGQIVILPDVGGTAVVDPRSPNEILLANVKALLAGKSLDDAQMYKIGERELTKMPIKDLLYWEGILEIRVRRERARKGQYQRTSTVGITFGGR